MRRSRLKCLLQVATCFVCSTHASTSSSRQTILRRLTPRGGSSPYEINPDYVLSPSSRRPVTLGDLERPSQQQQQYYVATPKLSSPLEQVKTYATQLHELSPTLSIGSAFCIFIWLLWQRPQCQRFLQDNFVCSRYNIRQGRHLTTLTSAVSHASFMHLVVNLFAYLSFGPSLVQTLSTAKWSLWPFVVGAAYFSSHVFLMFAKQRGGGGCMGLSGVTLAFLAFFARLYPQKELGLMLMGIIPVRMQAQVALYGLIGWSLIGAIVQRGRVAHSAHLGGLLYGMAYYELWTRRAVLRRMRGTIMRRRG